MIVYECACMYAVTVMCIHDVCIVRFYVFIHVSMRICMYVCPYFVVCLKQCRGGAYRVLYVFQRHIDFKSRLSENGEKATSQNGDNESIFTT